MQVAHSKMIWRDWNDLDLVNSQNEQSEHSSPAVPHTERKLLGVESTQNWTETVELKRKIRSLDESQEIEL